MIVWLEAPPLVGQSAPPVEEGGNRLLPFFDTKLFLKNAYFLFSLYISFLCVFVCGLTVMCEFVGRPSEMLGKEGEV